MKVFLVLTLLASLAFSIQITLTQKDLNSIEKQVTIKSPQLDSKNFDLKINQTNQFIFNKNLTLNDTFPQITEIRSLDSNTILLRGKTEDGQEKVKLLSGSQYEKKENELKIPSEFQQVKFVKDKILINTGNLIEEKSATESFEFVYKNKTLSRAMLVTQKYLLINQIGLCDKLIRIWFGSMQVEVIEFNSQQCSYNWNFWFMKDLGNGEVAFGGELAFFILDKESLRIKQRIPVPRGWYEDMVFTGFDSFHDKQTNTTTLQLSTAIAITRWKNLVYKFSNETKKYQLVNQIYTTDYKLKLIGTNEALSFKNNIVHNWNNMDFLKALSFDNFGNSFLRDRTYVLVSNQQNFFVVLFNSSNNFFLELYEMDQSFRHQIMFNFNTSLTHITQITSDDKFLFTMSRNQIQLVTLRIFVINTQQNVEIKAQTDQQFLTFHLFDATLDKFIILLRKTEDSLFSQSNSTYWVQIRKISEPTQIIQQIQLTDFPLVQEGSMDFKIVSNNKWGLKFVLYCLQNSVAVLYNIENDILTKEIETESNKFSSGIFASSEYLIHIDGNKSSLKLYSYNKLQLIEQIDTDLVNLKQNTSDSYILKDDKLLLRPRGYLDSRSANIYDFTRQKGERYVGKLQTLYMSCNTMFFPKRQFVYYYSTTSVWQPYDPSKAVFDTEFPIDKEYTLVGQDLDSYIYGYFYIQKDDSQEQCDRIALLDSRLNNSDIIIWRKCADFTDYKVYPGSTSSNIFQKNIFFSSHKQYLIGLFRALDSYNIQIRNINQDFNIVNNLSFSRGENIYGVSYTQDNLLVLLGYNQVKIFSVFNQTQSLSFGIKSIISFDSNDNLDIFFVGQNQDSTPENPIHSLFVVDSSHRTLFQKNITKSLISFNTVTLQKNGQKLLFSYKVTETTNQLTVWDLVDNESLLETQIQGKIIKQILFLDENQLLLNIDGKISIMNLIEQQKVSKENNLMFDFTDFPNASIYAVSNDGNLLAFVTDNSTVDIYDKLQNQVGHIKLQKNETSIASLTFTPNNTLLVIDNQSVISSFSQSSCPHGFDNVDSYCLCLRQHANPQTCECNNNFQEQSDLTCQCLDPFILNQLKCECRQNQTQFNQACQCKENFSLKGLECLCESPFIMKQDGTCQCPLNTTQNQNQCLCKENFIGAQGSCSCPEGFSFEQQKCFCPSSRYIWQKQCIECSVWCSECTGSGFECSSFSWIFYCLVIGGGVVLVGIVFLVVKIIRKSNKKSKTKENVNKSQNNLLIKDLIDESQEKTEKLI